MQDLVLWLTDGTMELNTYTIVALFALTTLLESVSVAIGHMASLGRN